MPEQDRQPTHELSIFLTTQGLQLLLQAIPIELAAVVIAQGKALLLHPGVEVALVQRSGHNRPDRDSPITLIKTRPSDHMRSRVGMPSRPNPSLSVSAVRRQRARREERAGSSALSTDTWS